MTTYAFTSISANYAPKARVLAESIREHDPDVRFCLLLSDPAEKAADLASPLFDEVTTADRLGIEDFKSWMFKHRLVEACTAVKGRFLQLLLERDDCEAVFYFDPDIVVLSELDVLAREFSRGSVLLTPHLTRPETEQEGILDNELSALRHGVYNLGFLGVHNTAEGKQFADWWWSRLQDYCYDDIPYGIFTDQRWVDLAPALFDDIAIVRNPGWNVATWNLTGRRVEGNLASRLTANGEPVLFYHFSGLDSGAQLAMLDKYGGSMPALYDLRRWYLERCLAHGANDEDEASEPWSYGRFSNGCPITTEHRLVYRERLDLQEAFSDPFDTEDVNASYFHWFTVTYPTEGGVLTFGENARAAIYRRELDAILTSRSWKLAQLLRRTFGPGLALARKLRNSLTP